MSNAFQKEEPSVTPLRRQLSFYKSLPNLVKCRTFLRKSVWEAIKQNYYDLSLAGKNNFHVTLERKTSHKGTFSQVEIYASSESWINNISIDVWFVMIGQYLKIWNLKVQKNLNIEKNIFKVVQMKFLAMHINNQNYVLIHLRY